MSPSLHLIIQYANDRRPERAAEYDHCVRENLANPAIVAVHNLVEPHVTVPDEFTRHPKYRQTRVADWLTYEAAFAYASAHLAGECVGVCNLDIFLDPTSDWAAAAAAVRSNIVLCLSRIEWDQGGRTFRDPGLEQWGFANSQDAWLFLAPFEVTRADFEIGTLGCDNAIAERIKSSGRIPVNAASRFRIFHYDRARGKSAANSGEMHVAERAHRPRRRPEEDGQYLLPDIDTVKSVDRVLEALNVTELDRYRVICDAMSRFVKIGNP